MSTPAQANEVYRVLHEALAADPRTRQPLNALILWTELAKGLQGTLDQVGADHGHLRSVVAQFCRGTEAQQDVDLTRWIPRMEPEERLGKVEAAMALKRVQAALEDSLPELAAEAATEGDGRREAFLTVVKGWFPLGMDIVRALPGVPAEDLSLQRGILWAWCDKYFPASTATPAELGVRVERTAD